MARHDQYSLLLLAGGKSSRMGTNKAELTFEGKTFLEHMLDKARELGIEKYYISGYASSREDVCTVWDHYENRGPLGGLHACMKVMDTPYCLVLPVDAPNLPQKILEALLSCHEDRKGDDRVLIWEHGDRMEPLIAVYPIAMTQTIEELIRESSAPVFRVLDRWGYACFRLETEDEEILNVNTPQLYQKLLSEKEGS